MNCVKMNPSGNITLLVTDAVPRNRQSEIANRLMRMVPDSEQVGFLEEATLPGAIVRLQMMGGEFCGNATMSAAAWAACKLGLGEGEEALYRLEVSGAQDVIPCRIHRSGDVYTGTVPMPLPEEIRELEILSGLCAPLVRFPGIDHVILPEGTVQAADAEQLIPMLCAALNADAMGLIFINPDMDAIRPLVYVRSTDSAVWENACGSGTAAVGAWQAFVRKQSAHIEIGQPNPDTRIGVSARYENGRICGLEITGRVRIEETRNVML